VSQKFAIEVGGLPAVMPALRLGSGQAPAGIQNPTKSPPLLRGRQRGGRGFQVAPPRESGDHAGLPEMTIELCNELLIQDTSLTLWYFERLKFCYDLCFIHQLENPSMCEYCSKSETTVEKLPSDEQFPCEWISEEFGPGACAELATYSVSDWFVEDHLCETHKRATEKEMQEEGLGDFLESAGFRAEFEIRPIQQEEDCDYMDPTAMDWKLCGKKASYAKYILDTSLYCAEHAAEAGGGTKNE